jgi:uncharacterized membrane protein
VSRVRLPGWRWLLVACVAALAASTAARRALEAVYPGSVWAALLGNLVGPVIGAVIGVAAGQQTAARERAHPYEEETTP